MKILTATIALAIAGAAGLAIAQTAAPSLLSAALADGSVGEQADGYMGFRSTPAAALRAEVDAINIKRRAAYTQLSQQRNVTPKEVAAAVGCETLAKRVAVGRAYMLTDNVWRVRKAGEEIKLPDYCTG
jgi:uncharacterized protein YdbL (DUF1318 family)